MSSSSSSSSEKGTAPSDIAADKASDRQLEEMAAADINFDHHKITERHVSVGVTSEDAYKPLRRLHKAALLAETDHFLEKFGLTESRNVFRRGALVAQRSKEFLNISELSDADKTDLSFEQKHMWKPLPSPRLLWYVRLV